MNRLPISGFFFAPKLNGKLVPPVHLPNGTLSRLIAFVCSQRHRAVCKCHKAPRNCRAIFKFANGTVLRFFAQTFSTVLVAPLAVNEIGDDYSYMFANICVANGKRHPVPLQ